MGPPLRKGGAFEERQTVILLSDAPEKTFLLGEDFGRRARGGEVIALTGPLGAGKTLFVKGLGKGLGIPESSISSPTFVLMHMHEGRLPLYHIDLYRLDSGAAVEALGLDEFIEGNGVAAVEWAGKGGALLPDESLKLEIRYGAAGQREGAGDWRTLLLTSSGDRHRAWIDWIKESGAWKIQN